MKSGAQPGNQNAKKGRQWQRAIKRALARYADANGQANATARKGLDLVATKFVAHAASGEAWAMKELGDRIDGKPTQAVEVSGPDGGSIDTKMTMEFVDASASPKEI